MGKLNIKSLYEKFKIINQENRKKAKQPEKKKLSIALDKRIDKSKRLRIL